MPQSRPVVFNKVQKVVMAQAFEIYLGVWLAIGIPTREICLTSAVIVRC
jgi:hypothetical protein